MTTALIGYVIYLLILVAVNAAVIYHFSKFCFPGDVTRIVVVIYSIIFLSVITGTFFLIGVI